jgi:hypothetical protein
MASETARIFYSDRYVVVRSLLTDPKLSSFYRYVCQSAVSMRLAPGDQQVAGTPSAYGDFMMEGLLVDLQPEIESAVELSLFPTYSYLRLYKQGDTLAKHTDRPACEISVSLCLGYEAAKAWPIWIEGPYGTTSASLQPGDALLYRGTECLHWRETFEGERMAQVFLHYVDALARMPIGSLIKEELFPTFRACNLKS